MKISDGWILDLAYFFICPLLLIFYLLEPFTQDVRIYLGAAKVTALTAGFPMSLDSVWESRFIGHRFLYLVLDTISPFEGWFYSVWMKLVVALATIGILYYFSKQVSEKIQVPFHFPFLIGYLGLFAVNTFVIFSSEFFSVVVAMLMLSLLLDNRRWCWFMAGLLILPLLLLKGLPVLLVFIVMPAVVLLVPDYKDRFLSFGIGLPFVGAGLGSVALYFPHFISDIIFSTKMAHLGNLGYWDTCIYFVKYGAGVIGFIPVCILGLFVIFLILSFITKDRLKDLGLLLIMWGVSFAYVLIIAEFFYYHYYLMLIPSIITICYFLKYYEYLCQAFWGIFVAILIIYVCVVSSWSIGLAGKGYVHWTEYDHSAESILQRYDLVNQSSLLYLDDGLSSYYMPTVSACRYVGALPYQRHMPYWIMSGSPEYWEMRGCAMNYTGKYIIVDRAFMRLNASTHQDVANKIDSEYKLVYTNYWEIYERNVGVIDTYTSI